ncbi:MAG: hypothetical protein HN413_15630 [Chloroflexi bacterium]|jgi:hypothetical protein|nr:hypothetical protein [Chloroflexota bacterium]
MKAPHRFIIITILLLAFSLLFSPQPARAHLDYKHYIPPQANFHNSSGAHYLFLSTPSTTDVTVTVEWGDGSPVGGGTYTVRNNSPQQILVNGNLLDGDTSLNQITTAGLIISADALIYANIRHQVASQGASLTAKGYAALGTRFRVGLMRSVDSSSNSSCGNFISVMASEDNTTVNFSDIKQGVIFQGTSSSGSPQTTDSFNVILDAGESYTFVSPKVA